MGVCYTTLLLLTPAVVGYIDLGSNVNYPAASVYVCVHGGVAEECSKVIPLSSNHVVSAKTYTLSPLLEHNKKTGSDVVRL